MKRIIGLPSSTPNYIIGLESGFCDLFIFTLKSNLKYLYKIFEYDDYRYPKIIAVEMQKKRLFLFKGLEEIEIKCQEKFCYSNGYVEMHQSLDKILEKMKINLHENYILKARNSNHGLYSQLNYNGPEFYFNKTKDKSTIQIILKARAGILNLNYTKENERNKQCSLCNMNEIEDVSHFLCRCPILNEFRLRLLNCQNMSTDQLLQFLGGSNLETFVTFLREAVNYRKILIREFNF